MVIKYCGYGPLTLMLENILGGREGEGGRGVERRERVVGDVLVAS